MPSLFDRPPEKKGKSLFDTLPTPEAVQNAPRKARSGGRSLLEPPVSPKVGGKSLFASKPIPEIAPDALKRTPLPQEVRNIREAIEDPGDSYFLKTLEAADTPRQIMLRAAHKMLTGSFEKLPDAPRGDAGSVPIPKKHLEFEDILEDIGVPKGPTVGVPMLGDVSARGVVGFAGDIFLDPLNLVGIGIPTKVGKLAMIVKSAEKIEEASKIGRAVAKAQKAGQNLELAETAAGQARAGQRALVSFAGHSLVQGAPIFEGARVVKEYIARSAPGKALRTMFSTKTGLEDLDSLLFRYRNLMTSRLRQTKEEFEELGKTLKDSEIEEINKIATILDQALPIEAMSHDASLRHVIRELEKATTDPAVTEVGAELKTRFLALKTAETELGILTSELVNYFPRILTKEGRKALEKGGKVNVRIRTGGTEFSGKLGAAKERTTKEFTIDEFNAKLAEKGIAEFFTTDPVLAGYIRTVGSVRARTSMEMFNELKARGLVKGVRPDPELLRLQQETGDRIARRAFADELAGRTFRAAKARTLIPEPGAILEPPKVERSLFGDFKLGALKGRGVRDPYGMVVGQPSFKGKEGIIAGETSFIDFNPTTGHFEAFDLTVTPETREALKTATTARAKKSVSVKEFPSAVREEFVEAAKKRVAFAEKELAPFLANQAAVKAGRLAEIKGVKGLEGYAADPEIAAFLTRQHKALTDPGEMNAIADYYDQAQNWWKAWTLFIFPGYHFRNQASNAWLSWQAGMRNPHKLVAAMAIEKGDNLTIKSATGQVYKADEIRKLIDDWNINGSGLYGADVPSAVKEVSVTAAEKGKSLLSKTLGSDSVALEAGLRAGTAMENVWRRALFMDGLEKGLSPQLAAERVMKYLFDYSDLAQFEKSVMKRAMPFWSWTRKNIPVQLESLVTEPYKFTMIEKAREQVEGDDAPHVPHLPDFFREYVPIRVRKREDGTHEYFLLGGWMPAADIERLFGIERISKLALDLLTPFAGAVIEQGLNISKFSGRPIEHFPGEKEIFLNQEMPRRVVKALKNIRLLSELDNLIRESPAYPEQVLTGEAKALRALTGIKVQRFDPTREKIMREKRIRKSVIREVYKRAGEQRALQLQRELSEK